MAKYIECEAIKKSIVECCGDFTEKDAEYIIEHIPDKEVIELSCKIGDKIYQTDFVRLYESTINEITITPSKTIYVTENIVFDERAIHKSIFLTKEEATQVLKGSE